MIAFVSFLRQPLRPVNQPLLFFSLLATYLYDLFIEVPIICWLILNTLRFHYELSSFCVYISIYVRTFR